jgi:hypothetical protein
MSDGTSNGSTSKQALLNDVGLPATISSSALQWLLGVGPARISALVNSGVIRRTGPNEYDIGSIRDFIAHQRKASDGGGKAWNSARVALTREKAEKARLEREAVQGKLIDRDVACNSFNTVVRNSVHRLLGVGTKIAARVAAQTKAADCEETIRGAIEDALHELADAPIRVVSEKKYKETLKKMRWFSS